MCIRDSNNYNQYCTNLGIALVAGGAALGGAMVYVYKERVTNVRVSDVASRLEALEHEQFIDSRQRGKVRTAMRQAGAPEEDVNNDESLQRTHSFSMDYRCWSAPKAIAAHINVSSTVA